MIDSSTRKVLEGKTVVVDIDDTLLKTTRRKQAVWKHVLGKRFSLKTIESRGSREILDEFASSNRKVWERFWRVMLCHDEVGKEFLKYEKPLPHAAEVLRSWNSDFKLTYLTGRSRNMREITLQQLDGFGFPVETTEIMMPPDWEDHVAAPLKVRENLFSKIWEKSAVQRVVDDHADYFSVYKHFGVPERIGMLRPKRYTRRDYMSYGATSVVTDWRQLLSDGSGR